MALNIAHGHAGRSCRSIINHGRVFDAFLRPALAQISTWRARARQRRALAELDDRLLKDVGIERGAAAQEARKPFWK